MSGRVDIGEGLTIGIHALKRLRILARATKQAAQDGLTDDEVIALAEGPGRDLVVGFIADVREARED